MGRSRAFRHLAAAVAAGSVALVGCGDGSESGSAPVPSTAVTMADVAPADGVVVNAPTDGLRWRMPHAPTRSTSTTALADGSPAEVRSWTDRKSEPAVLAVGIISLAGNAYDLGDGMTGVVQGLGCNGVDTSETTVHRWAGLRSEVTGCDGDRTGTVFVLLRAEDAIVVVAVGSEDQPTPWTGDQLVSTFTELS